ncbi:hypothetical protein [Shewanella sp. 125m-1]
MPFSFISQSNHSKGNVNRPKKPLSQAIIFNRLLSLCFLSAYVTTANADPTRQCEQINPAHLSATYSATNASGQQSTITLLRSADKVIYQRSPTSFEMWDKQGEYVRYFPTEQRSITYRKGDLLSLNMHFDLQQLTHLISPELIKQLSNAQHETAAPSPEQHETHHSANLSCQAVAHYEGLLAGNTLNLVWMTKLMLPVTMTVQQKGKQFSYQLTEIEPFSSDAFAALISNYNDMDFADVGDNESDPFIAKMIHQGFIQHGSSGFYDSQGNQLSSGESGHQH